MDKKGADILLIHNAGEFLSWPENPAAFAILFDAAGINWTLSSELVGYDAVNYAVWFDDVELARIALRHVSIARDLGVKKIVVGECGHAHKALCVIADRVLPGDLSLSEMPRESCLPLLWDIVRSGAIRFDPSRNDFPITLHDSCNVVRLMGIVQPQREIVKAVCAQPVREMAPHGVHNYCCGGGSGFAIMDTLNFSQWRERRLGADEGEADPGHLRRCPRPRHPQVRDRGLLQLQGHAPRRHQLLRPLGATRHLVRRAGRSDRQRHGRPAGAVHRRGTRRCKAAARRV